MALKPSGPGAFPAFSFFIALSISCTVIGPLIEVISPSVRELSDISSRYFVLFSR